MSKIIGIIGGMGPAATCDLYYDIIKHTPGKTDQDHIRVLIDSNVKIPDRTKYILNLYKDQIDTTIWKSSLPVQILNNYEKSDQDIKCPFDYIVQSAKQLENAGSDFLIMSCNTAHYFINKIQDNINIPILSMPEAIAQKLSTEGIKRASILATYGTICGSVYDNIFKKYDIECVYPDYEDQKIIMEIIFDYVKTGRLSELDKFKSKMDVY